MEIGINFVTRGDQIQIWFPLGTILPTEKVTIVGSLTRGFALIWGDHGSHKVSRGRSSPGSRDRIQVARHYLGVRKSPGCTKEQKVPVRVDGDRWYVDAVDMDAFPYRKQRERGSKNVPEVPMETIPVAPQRMIQEAPRETTAGQDLIDACKRVRDAVQSGDLSIRLEDGRPLFTLLVEI